MDAFFTHANDAPEDKTGSLPVLASALCQSHAYPQAIAKLQSGLQMANETYGPGKLPAGLSAFLPRICGLEERQYSLRWPAHGTGNRNPGQRVVVPTITTYRKVGAFYIAL